MSQSLRSVMLDVDLSAIRHNLALVQQLAGDREVIASIKANAYGFGVVEVSRALAAAGVGKLWTGNIDEAIALRDAGIDAEILLFGGPEPDRLEAALRHDLQPTIYDDTTFAALVAAAGAVGQRAPVWVKVDAGLERLGTTIDAAFDLIKKVAATPQLDLRGVYTHLPFGTVEGKAWAARHYDDFGQLVDRLRDAGVEWPITQVWGSSGLLAQMPDFSNAVCVGHALFGLTPLAGDVASPIDLKPALRSLSAAILRVHPIGQGSGSGGYGAGGNGLGATVAAGLGDGLRRADGGQGHVIVGGRRVPIRAFTLEHLMIDASDASPQVLDRATIIGEADGARITLDDWAQWTGASPLELMMSLSGRTPVSYV